MKSTISEKVLHLHSNFSAVTSQDNWNCQLGEESLRKPESLKRKNSEIDQCSIL